MKVNQGPSTIGHLHHDIHQMMIAYNNFFSHVPLRLLTFRPRAIDLTYNSLKDQSSRHFPSFTSLLVSG